MRPNRRLLISVFTPQEVREALVGGARIIDCEDPRTSLGNISPYAIMTLSAAVLAWKRDETIQISTNIGEDQLLFDKGQNGVALQKFPSELAGKAAQAALGVAAAMGTQAHPVNIIKIGIDAMPIDLVREVLTDVVRTVRRDPHFGRAQIVPVFFIRDMEHWNERKHDPSVIKQLIELREFFPDEHGDIDLATLYTAAELARILPEDASSTNVRLNELHPYANFGFGKNTQDAVKKAVDVCAETGVDGLMLDTSIQLKIVRVSMLKHQKNSSDRGTDGKLPPREGIMTLDEARYFCEYCHWMGLESYLAGSIQDYHAPTLWSIEALDSIAVRGGASVVVNEPGSGASGKDTRHDRRIARDAVRRFVPPEQT